MSILPKVILQKNEKIFSFKKGLFFDLEEHVTEMEENIIFLKNFISFFISCLQICLKINFKS